MTTIRSGDPAAELGGDDLAVWWFREFVRMYFGMEPGHRCFATWRVGQDLSKTVGALLAAKFGVPERELELIGSTLFERPVEEAPGQDFVTLETESLWGGRRS